MDAPLRRRGVGSALLAAAERAAAEDGRDLVHVECMSFQSPALFVAHGYNEYARLNGYGGGAERVHLWRTLDASSASRASVDGAPAALGLHLEVTTAPASEDLATVRSGLSSWNEQVYRPAIPQPLNVLLRGPGGQVWGGLTAATCWNGCFVDLFWVDTGLRHRGFGSAILHAAEKEAQRRGCDFVHLDTFNFQARGFYEKLGYSVYGTLRGFAEGAERYHLVKRLA